MSSLSVFKRKLSAASRLWEQKDYDQALAEIEGLLKVWPGNPQLHLLWASLVQLQENPQHSLEDARRALQKAVDLDNTSPAAAIELGHFLDGVEDNPQAASKAYADGVAAAQQLLIEGLIGQAKTFLQLDKKQDARRCLLEALHLVRCETGSKRSTIEELLSEVIASRSA